MSSVTISMTPERASAVADALSYWLLAAEDNFGSGYDKSDVDDMEQRDRFNRVKGVFDRLQAKLDDGG